MPNSDNGRDLERAEMIRQRVSWYAALYGLILRDQGYSTANILRLVHRRYPLIASKLITQKSEASHG